MANGLLQSYENGAMGALNVNAGVNLSQQIENYAYLHNTYSLNGIPTITDASVPSPTQLVTGTITTYADNSPEGVSF